MENSAGVSTLEQAPASAEPMAAAPQAETNNDVVKAPEVTGLGGDNATASSDGAMDLIFKVANATVAAVAYEASCNSPTAAEASPALQTPQKRVDNGSSPQQWTGTTEVSGNNGDDHEDDSNFDATTLDMDDDDDGFRVSNLSGHRSHGSSQVGSNYGSNYGGKGGRNRRNWNRQEDNESRTATARRAPPRSTAPLVNQSRPPLPPPTGSLKALPAEHVQKFLKLVQDGEYNEALKALRKVRRAVKGRGCSKEAFGGMRALLHHLLEGYASAGQLDVALELLKNMKESQEARLVGAAAFNALLRGLLSRSAIEEARYVVRDKMKELSVTPNEGSLNLLMDTAARAGPDHLDEAWDVLEEMQKRGMRADKYTVSILTKGISDRGDKRRLPPRGVQLVEHFLKTQSEDVDEVLVNSLLDVFCRMGDMPRLEATLQKMREYGIKGSAVTYGTIVKAYGKAGNIDKVLQAWSEMSRLGLEANAVTYGCMLDACVKCGHLEKALQVFDLMKKGNLHRNMILYATIIKGFAKSKNPLDARKLYQEMVSEGVTCNVVVFNSLIDACVRANDLQGAAEVLQEMTAAGVKPDLITFSTLIKGYCSSNELGKAMRLADELRARDLECDEIVYNSLLEGCVKAGDLQLGLRLFEEMRTARVRPSSVTFSILVKLLHRAGRLDLACHLVAREMREMHGVIPTRMVWSCLVTCCVKARDLTRAVMVLDLLDREGGAVGSARTSMYATVIEGCLTQGEVGIALALCERAYSRVPPEEGVRGILSADLLRRVFEAVGARGPEAEARATLESISSRLSEQVRTSLEDALSRGSRRRSPRANGGGRDARGSAPRVGVSEASSIASLGADALLSNPAVGNAWGGSVVAAAAQQCPPYTPGGYQGFEVPAAMANGLPPMWDPAAAMAAASFGQMPWPGPVPGAQGMDAYAGPYGYGGFGADPYYGAAWQWPPAWDDGSNWAANAGSPGTGPAPTAAETDTIAAAQTGPLLSQEPLATTLGQTMPDTPKPDKIAETPSTASGAGQSTVERTPATTAGRSSDARSPAEEDADDEEQTPVNMRLFAPEASCVGGKSAPMRVEVPLSALLEGPPGLH